jgi:integrase
MAIKILNRRGDWLVQVQRNGQRATRRGTGGERVAKTAEAELTAKLEAKLRRAKAAQELGLEQTKVSVEPPPTLVEFLTTRWAAHARVVQNDTTRRNTKTHVRYLTYFLGDKRLDQITVSDINQVVERLHEDGPISFSLTKAGEPRQRRRDKLTPTSINRLLETLKAALRFAQSESVIASVPAIRLLPRDESRSVVPPSADQLSAIVEASRDFVRVGAFFPDVIELAAETGLRESELFNLHWRSVDLTVGETGAVRIEEQQRARLVGGRPWKPKHKKFRVVPLSGRAREIIDALRTQVPNQPTDLVIPNRGGCPYVRIEHAPDRAGKGWWHDVLFSCGLKNQVTFHALRHYFAVNALQRGVPIAVVSEWLGHSDVNLTVKRYGRWSSDAREQWQWVQRLNKPIQAVLAQTEGALPPAP